MEEEACAFVSLTKGPRLAAGDEEEEEEEAVVLTTAKWRFIVANYVCVVGCGHGSLPLKRDLVRALLLSSVVPLLPKKPVLATTFGSSSSRPWLWMGEGECKAVRDTGEGEMT